MVQEKIGLHNTSSFNDKIKVKLTDKSGTKFKKWNAVYLKLLITIL